MRFVLYHKQYGCVYLLSVPGCYFQCLHRPVNAVVHYVLGDAKETIPTGSRVTAYSGVYYCTVRMDLLGDLLGSVSFEKISVSWRLHKSIFCWFKVGLLVWGFFACVACPYSGNDVANLKAAVETEEIS